MCDTLDPITGGPVFRSNYKALYSTLTSDIYLEDLAPAGGSSPSPDSPYVSEPDTALIRPVTRACDRLSQVRNHREPRIVKVCTNI